MHMNCMGVYMNSVGLDAQSERGISKMLWGGGGGGGGGGEGGIVYICKERIEVYEKCRSSTR